MLFTEITSADLEKHKKHINKAHVKKLILNCRNERSVTKITIV